METQGLTQLRADIAAAGFDTMIDIDPYDKRDQPETAKSGRLFFPAIEEIGQSISTEPSRLLTTLATTVASEQNYMVMSFAMSKLSTLRPVVEAYNKRNVLGGHTYSNNHFPGLLQVFVDRLSEELVEHGVEVTASRVANLLAFRFARGLGYTVESKTSNKLPAGTYEWLAADTDTRIMILNFSNLLNPNYSRRKQTPISLTEEPEVRGMTVEYLRNLFAPEMDFSQFLPFR